MFLLLVVTGAIWLLDRLVLHKRRPAGQRSRLLRRRGPIRRCLPIAERYRSSWLLPTHRDRPGSRPPAQRHLTHVEGAEPCASSQMRRSLGSRPPAPVLPTRARPLHPRPALSARPTRLDARCALATGSPRCASRRAGGHHRLEPTLSPFSFQCGIVLPPTAGNFVRRGNPPGRW